jgi:hypothetical protein
MRCVLLSVIFLACLNSSCEKKNSFPDGALNIYLLSDQDSREALWEIDETKITLEEKPLINYKDIMSYDPGAHVFKITSSARDRIKSLANSLHTCTFAMVADKEIIYTGYFWASFSSAICPWLTIDPIFAQYAGELKVQLGYPGVMEGISIPDRRNDERLLGILRHDGKLLD